MRTISIPTPQYISNICRKLSKKTRRTPMVNSMENFAESISALSFLRMTEMNKYIRSVTNEKIPVRESIEKTVIFNTLYSPLMSSGIKVPNESKYNRIITEKTVKKISDTKYLIFLSL